MEKDKIVEFSIRSTVKKNCWEIEELELSQNLLEGTGYEEKYPNWMGQVKVYQNVYRSGSFYIKQAKLQYPRINSKVNLGQESRTSDAPT